MKNLKKLLLFLLLIPMTFSCDKDDEDSSSVITEPTNFYEAHNGVWVVTLSNDGSQALLDIYDSGWDSYNRATNSGCWSSPVSIGGSTTITSNTPDELLGETINIPASNVFNAVDTQILLDAGYTTVSVDQAYLHTSSVYISFAQYIYAGTFEVELLNIAGNYGKQSSDSFSICKNNSTKIYELSDEAIEILRNLSASN